MEDQCHQGLKLVLLLEGALNCDLPVIGRERISGPCLCAIMDRSNHVSLQCFDPKKRLRYVQLSVDSDDLGTIIGTDLNHFAQMVSEKPLGQAPLLVMRKPTAALNRLALQILTVQPGHNPGSQLYRSGKTLELAGLAMDQLTGAMPPNELADMKPADVERLYAARDLLLERLDSVSDLAMLARATGLNVRKLSRGFRALFGASPSAWLQMQRLDRAHRMIADGEWTVSQAAWKVGYTPAAFSTAFRRRFGISPNELRH